MEHVGEVVVGDELAPEGARLEQAVQRQPRVVPADLAGAGLVDGARGVLGRDVVLHGVLVEGGEIRRWGWWGCVLTEWMDE